MNANKFLVAALAVLACCAASSTASAQACKPDVSQQDVITKQRVVKFLHNVTEAGFMKSMMATDIGILVIAIRSGSINAINIQITKVTNDRDQAALDSRYRAAKGDQFVFGFKSGEPLSFVASEVSSESQIQQAKGLVMTVVMSARLADKDLAMFRDALTKRQIDAIRIGLASGQIERVVDDNNGKKLMAKLSCFYQYLDKEGIDLSAAASPDSQPGSAGDTPGKYMFVKGAGTAGDYTELKPDGSYTVREGKMLVSGTYSVKGDVVNLVMGRQTVQAKISGNTLVAADGTVYEKEAEAPKNVAVQGMYLRKGKSPDFIELRADGTFSCVQDNVSFGGNYAVQGETLVLTLLGVGTNLKNNQTRPVPKDPAKARIVGDELRDTDGITWVKQAQAEKPASQMTIDQVLEMVKAKLSDEVIISMIAKSGFKSAPTPDDLIRLKAAGVSDAVLRAVVK